MEVSAASAPAGLPMKGRMTVMLDARDPVGSLHRPPALEGASQGDLIGILQLTAHRQAVGDATHRRKRPQQSRQIEAGGIPFHAGGKGQDHLAAVFAIDPLHQRLDLQEFRPHAIHRRNQPTQHVIEPPELARALQGQEVAGIGYHTDHTGVALLVTADLAVVLGRQMEAAAALPHLAAGGEQGIGEGLDLFGGLAQQMQGQPLGRAWSDARQPFELIDQAGQGPGEAAQDSAAGASTLGSTH